MNMQNILELATTLEGLGFSEITSLLVKHICLLPDHFTIAKKVQKEVTAVHYRLFFETIKDSHCYTLVYFDATLQPGEVYPDTDIGGINIERLKNDMQAIDWTDAFDFNTRAATDPVESRDYEEERKIEGVVIALRSLEVHDEGKNYAIALKQRYWGEHVGNGAGYKIKSDLTQRFYYAENGLTITADEAHRFLQNRLWEKQLQGAGKQAENKESSDKAVHSVGRPFRNRGANEAKKNRKQRTEKSKK